MKENFSLARMLLSLPHAKSSFQFELSRCPMDLINSEIDFQRPLSPDAGLWAGLIQLNPHRDVSQLSPRERIWGPAVCSGGEEHSCSN